MPRGGVTGASVEAPPTPDSCLGSPAVPRASARSRAVTLISPYFPNIDFCYFKGWVLDQTRLWFGAICYRPGTPLDYSRPVNGGHLPLRRLKLTFVTRTFSLGFYSSGSSRGPACKLMIWFPLPLGGCISGLYAIHSLDQWSRLLTRGQKCTAGCLLPRRRLLPDVWPDPSSLPTEKPTQCPRPLRGRVRTLLRGMTTACPPLVFPLCLALPDSIPYYQGKMIGLYLNFREK